MSAYTEGLWRTIQEFAERKEHAILQINKYQSILERLEDTLRRTVDLEDVIHMLDIDREFMEANPDSVRGRLATTYERKEELHVWTNGKLCGELQNRVETIRKKTEEIRQECEYWKSEMITAEENEEACRHRYLQAVEEERRARELEAERLEELTRQEAAQRPGGGGRRRT